MPLRTAEEASRGFLFDLSMQSADGASWRARVVRIRCQALGGGIVAAYLKLAPHGGQIVYLRAPSAKAARKMLLPYYPNA